MKPVLFEIGNFTVHAYGLMIVIGAYLAYLFLSTAANKQFGADKEKIGNLIFIIAAAAFIGGKLLFYFEDPAYYFGHPSNMVKNIGGGFVFFGSLLFAVPATIWYFRKQKWPVIPMLDLIALTSLIVHGFGRIGCFLAGCCHGVPTESPLGVVFTDPMCQAEPLNTPLHPTQLYAVFMLGSILLFLNWFRKRKTFHGQVFLLYVMLYSVGRSIIEVFRGDEARGYIIDGILTHSQFISLLVFTAAAVTYFIWKKRPSLKV